MSHYFHRYYSSQKKYFIRGLLQQFVCVQLKRNSSSIHRYEEIEKTLINSPDWPRMEGELLISGPIIFLYD